MTTQSETPRTDAWCELAMSADVSAVLDLAKQYERELNEAQIKCAEWQNKAQEAELRERQSQADCAAMREAFQNLKDWTASQIAACPDCRGCQQANDGEAWLNEPCPTCENKWKEFLQIIKQDSTTSGKELLERLEKYELELRLIGDIAVVDWDDTTVGKVDAVIPREPSKSYADKVRNLYKRAGDALKAEQELTSLRVKLTELETQVADAKAQERAAQKGARINSQVAVNLARSNSELRDKLTELRDEMTSCRNIFPIDI